MSIFGTSWKTTLVNYLIAMTGVAYQMATSGSVLPHTVEGWIIYLGSALVAIAGRVQKDYDVSNAPSPTDAAPIPPAVKP